MNQNIKLLQSTCSSIFWKYLSGWNGKSLRTISKIFAGTGIDPGFGLWLGRDTLAFKKKGYQVEAIDYSAELVEKARELTGIEVRQQSFYELNEVAKYDGIWACASLLHCERDRLTEVLGRIFKALKPNGVCYMSFKYGDTDREKEGAALLTWMSSKLMTYSNK